MSAIQECTEIIREVRSEDRQAAGAAVLSIYIYPRLDPRLRDKALSEVLWWIPFMRRSRFADILQHVGLAPVVKLGVLTSAQRKSLASYLDSIDSYRKATKGFSIE